MEGSRVRGSVTLEVPAKLNLLLKILGKRPDGYHELDMVNTAVEIFDRVMVTLTPEPGVIVECAHPDVPADENNTCHKAALLMLDEAGDNSGVQVKIEKNIPVAGGTAGGSADAAGVIFGLDRLLNQGLSASRLSELGGLVGADVPFFFHRSPARVGGIGDLVEAGPSLPDWYYLVVSFDFGVSTALAFSEYDLTSSQKRVSLSYLEGMDFGGVNLFQNDLETVVFSRHPVLEKAKKNLFELGSRGALMSGSGPTVFGVFDTESMARAARERISRHFDANCRVTRAITGPMIRVV